MLCTLSRCSAYLTTGEIPPEISNLSRLLILKLDNNQLSGSCTNVIPTKWRRGDLLLPRSVAVKYDDGVQVACHPKRKLSS